MNARCARAMAAISVVVAAVAAAAAHAQSPAPGAAANLERWTPPPARSVRHTQAHGDRVILVPSAETQPAGTIFLSTYEVALLQVGYAPTDRLHASLTGLVTGQFIEAGVKANLLRSRHLRLAAQSSIDYARAEDDEEEDEDVDDLVFGRVGATVQLCFELRCRSSLSLAATLVIQDQASIVLPIGLGAGFTAFIADDVSLLLEYSTLINAARDLELLDLPLYLVAYGARVSASPRWALDIAFLKDLDSDEDEIRAQGPTLFDVLGVPFLAFTYRFLR